MAYGLHVRAEYQDLDHSLVTTAQHFEDELLSTESASVALAQPVESDVSVRLYDQALAPLPTARGSSQPVVTPSQVLTSREGPAYSFLVRWLPGATSYRRGAFATARDQASGHRLRFYTLPVGQAGQRGYVLTWKSLHDLDASARFLGFILAGVAPGGVLAAGVGTYAVASNVLRPVGAMTQTARAIAASRGFSRRLGEPDRPDELGLLARTFNEILSSLEEAYRLQQRFVADAAHELRAPLTAIQGNIELIGRNTHLATGERKEAFAY